MEYRIKRVGTAMLTALITGASGGIGYELAQFFARDRVPLVLCGWKTRAMFDRYNIIDEADLAEAVAKRFKNQSTANKGQTAANVGTPTAPLSPLSCSPA
jgi:NAD(P)-dependent dehydrogenase (short-subunit alcohol dehydrogenase family)